MNQAKKQQLKQVKNVYSFWGRFPSLYSVQDYITFLGRPKTIRRKAVEALHLQKGNKVLEIACGSGRNFQYLAEAAGKKGKIIGFDYSREMLDASKKLVQRQGWENFTLVQGDAAELKIGEKDFDGAISVLGISAIPSWEKALRRCKTVLKSGGSLVVCDAQLFTGRLKFFNPMIKLIYSRFAAWDPSKNIPKKMKKIFGNAEVRTFKGGTFFIAKSVKRKQR